MKYMLHLFCTICVICGCSSASRIADFDDVAQAKDEAITTATAYTVATATATLASAKAYTDTAVANITVPVVSFNTRTGAIVSQTGDYTAGMVGADPAGTATAVAAGKMDLQAGQPTGWLLTLDENGQAVNSVYTPGSFDANGDAQGALQAANNYTDGTVGPITLWIANTAGTLFAPITITDTLATATANIANLQNAGYITSTGTAAMITGTISHTQVSGLGSSALTSSTAYDAAGSAISAIATVTGAINTATAGVAVLQSWTGTLGTAAYTSATAYDSAGAALGIVSTASNALQSAINLCTTTGAVTALIASSTSSMITGTITKAQAGLTTNGTGTMYLSDDGTYKAVVGGGGNITEPTEYEAFLSLLLPARYGTTTANVSLNSSILGTGTSINLYWGGTGTLTLNAVNTNVGSFYLWGGELALGVSSCFPAANPLIMSNSTTLNVNGLNQSFNQLSSITTATTSKITNRAATPCTLTFTNTTGTSSFYGVIENGTGGISITKTGAGEMDMNGVNTCTGEVVVSGGTLGFASHTLDSAPSITLNGGSLFWSGYVGNWNRDDVSSKLIFSNSPTTISSGELSGGGSKIYFSNPWGYNSTGTGVANTTVTLGGGYYVFSAAPVCTGTIVLATNTAVWLNLANGLNNFWGSCTVNSVSTKNIQFDGGISGGTGITLADKNWTIGAGGLYINYITIPPTSTITLSANSRLEANPLNEYSTFACPITGSSYVATAQGQFTGSNSHAGMITVNNYLYLYASNPNAFGKSGASLTFTDSGVVSHKTGAPITYDKVNITIPSGLMYPTFNASSGDMYFTTTGQTHTLQGNTSLSFQGNSRTVRISGSWSGAYVLTINPGMTSGTNTTVILDDVSGISGLTIGSSFKSGSVFGTTASKTIIHGGDTSSIVASINGSTPATCTVTGSITFSSATARLRVATNGIATASKFTCTTTCNLGTATKVDVMGALNTGTYTLIQATGVMSGTLPTTGTNATTHTINLIQTGNNLNLIVTP